MMLITIPDILTAEELMQARVDSRRRRVGRRQGDRGLSGAEQSKRICSCPRAIRQS